MVFNLTHSQLILRYKENGGRIEPYTIVIMGLILWVHILHQFLAIVLLKVYCYRIGGPYWGPSPGPKSGSQIGVPKWESILGVIIGGRYWGYINFCLYCY
jgi:hypothetical protein